MYTYSLTTNKNTILRSDGATIPVNPRNREYAEYLNWVAAGNVVSTAPVDSAPLLSPSPLPTPTIPSPAPEATIPSPVPEATSTPPVQEPVMSMTHTTSLELAKANQGRLISQACQDAIFAGFQSSALGAVYTYPYQVIDQVNLNTKVNAANIAMTSSAWTPGGTHKVGEVVIPPTKQAFICTLDGTSSNNPQDWNVGIGAIVDDGTCNWQIWTTHFWCKNSEDVWALNVHTAAQTRQVGLDGATHLKTVLQHAGILQMQLQAATDVETVQSITWFNSI